jgi:hypothetical protein
MSFGGSWIVQMEDASYIHLQGTRFLSRNTCRWRIGAGGPVAQGDRPGQRFGRKTLGVQASQRANDADLEKATTPRQTHSFAPNTPGSGQHRLLSTPTLAFTHPARHCSSPSWLDRSPSSSTNMAVAGTDGASSIQVTVRVRPFTIREAAQLTRSDEGPMFLGDGSLASAPAPHMKQKGIRPVIKVVDEKCL